MHILSNGLELILFLFLFYLFATHNKIHNKQEC